MSSEEKSLTKVGINWYPGHFAKTKRIISEKYDLIDVVYELIDARIPYSSKIRDIDNLIKNKKRILIMTKYDLCCKENTKKWVKYYEEQGYKVLTLDLMNNNDYKVLINLTNDLMKDVQKNREEKGLKKKNIHVLVIGIPNVGKSTLINRLAGKKVANVGNMPGVTKNVTWLKTKCNIDLLDTPGILWPKLDNDEVALNLASTSAIKIDILPVDKVACHILEKLNKYYPDILKERYGLDNIDDIVEAYEKIGEKIKAVLPGGKIDYKRVSLAIINDVKSGKIKNITFDNFM